MSKRHFIVSIKTIDDMLLFPTDFNGEAFLLGATAKASAKTAVFALAFAVAPNKNASPLKSVGKSSMSSMVLIDTMKCLLLITSLN